MLLDDKDWRLFQVLDDVRSIKSASKILYISQPAISLRIMRLEEILGVKLINRSPKGVQLTKQGDYFAEYSNEMLKKQDELQEEILNLNNKDRKSTRLNSSHVSISYAVF